MWQASLQKLGSKKTLWVVLSILLLTLVVRLVYIHSLANIDETFHLATGAGYEGRSNNLQIDHDNPNYKRFRLFNLGLSFLFDITGQQVVPVRLLALASGVVAAGFIVFLLYKYSRKGSFLASLLWALSPLAINVNLLIRDFTFFIPWNLFVVSMVVCAMRQTGRKWLVVSLGFNLATLIISALYTFYDQKSTFGNIAVLYVGLTAFVGMLGWERFAAKFLRRMPGLVNSRGVSLILITLATFIGVWLLGILLQGRSEDLRSFPGINLELANQLFLSNSVIWGNKWILIFPISLCAFLILKPLSRKQEREEYLLWSVFSAYAFFYILFFSRYVASRYFVFILPFALLIIAAAWVKLFQRWRQLTFRWRRDCLLLGIGFVMIIGAFRFATINVPSNANWSLGLIAEEERVDYDFYTHAKFLRKIGFAEYDAIFTHTPFGTIFFTPQINPVQNNVFFFRGQRNDNFLKLTGLMDEYDRGAVILLAVYNNPALHVNTLPLESFLLNGKAICFEYQEGGFIFYQWGFESCRPKVDLGFIAF